MSKDTGTIIEGSEANQKFLTAHLRFLITKGEDERSVRERVWEEHYKNYNSITGRRFYQGRANLHVPISFELVETMVPILMDTIYNTGIPFGVKAKGIDPDNKATAQIKKSVLAWQLEEMDFRSKLPGGLRNGCIYGTAFGKVVWRSEKSKRMRRSLHKRNIKDPETNEHIENPVTGEKMFDFDIKEGEVEVTDFEGNDVIILDPFTMFVDELTQDNDIQKARWVRQRSNKTWEELKSMYGDDIPDEMYKQGEWDLEDEQERNKRNTGSSEQESNQNPEDRYFTHDEFWLDWDFAHDFDGQTVPKIRQKNVVAVLIDEKVLVRAQRNPFWHGMKPFVSWPVYPRPNEFFGQGLLDPTRKLQYEINDTRNQSMDWRSMAMNQMWWVGRAAGLKDRQITIRQGGIVRVNDVNQVKPFTHQNIMGIAQQTELTIEENMRNASGATRSLQGAPLSTVRPATEISASISGGERRVGMMTSAFETSWLKPQLKMMDMNNQQFMRKDKKMMLLTDFGFNTEGFSQEATVGPEDLIGDVEFVFQGTKGIALDGAKGRLFMEFLQIAMTLDPTLQTNREIILKIMLKIWSDVFNLDPTEFGQIFGEKPFEAMTGIGIEKLLKMTNEELERQAQREAEEEAQGGGQTTNPQGSQVPQPDGAGFDQLLAQAAAGQGGI